MATQQPVVSAPPTVTDVGSAFVDGPHADPGVIAAATDEMWRVLADDLEIAPTLQDNSEPVFSP